jgi:hypothetical protein
MVVGEYLGQNIRLSVELRKTSLEYQSTALLLYQPVRQNGRLGLSFDHITTSMQLISCNGEWGLG